MPANRTAPALDDIRIHVRFKLAALWSSLIFCYLYGDYFELYRPGKLQGMLAGKMFSGDVTQAILLAMAALMAVPSLMVFLSLALPPRPTRWLNILCGALYTLIMVAAIRTAWHFYIVLGLVEITLTTLITWYAWTWPKQNPTPVPR